jgi:prepilin-type N-terminal cleavage/methylation domain-containing protein
VRAKGDVSNTRRSRRAPRRQPAEIAPSVDGGFSLPEILIAITLVGMAAASVLPAMQASIRFSKFSDTQAKVSAVLGNAVDRVTNFGWLACPATDADGGYLAKAQNAAPSVDWPASTISVPSIRYWDAQTGEWTTTNPIPLGDCTNTQLSWSKEMTLQLVTVSVTSPDGVLTNSVEVVMGDLRDDEERDAT